MVRADVVAALGAAKIAIRGGEALADFDTLKVRLPGSRNRCGRVLSWHNWRANAPQSALKAYYTGREWAVREVYEALMDDESGAGRGGGRADTSRRARAAWAAGLLRRGSFVILPPHSHLYGEPL